MKRILTILAMLLATMVAVAKPVNEAAARRVAQTWMHAMGMKNPAALHDVTPQTPFTEFYVFAAADGGFVLVSADDCVIPVLGYSTTSRFDTKSIPENVRGWLDDYEKEIRFYKRQQTRRGEWGTSTDSQSEAHRQWQMLLDGTMPPAPLLTSVSPMLTTTWNQSPLYNNLCPLDNNSGNRSVTGCVATATAQVMKYYNHPTTGYGSHTYTSSRIVNGTNYTFSNLTANFGTTTYQWSSMPNALTTNSTTAQINAVATLMYHIGVADEMKYTPNASGAHNYNYFGTLVPSSQTSLMQYFKYRPDMSAFGREDYTPAVYAAKLRAELDQSRPILYSGSNTSGGHSFVLDGYDNNGDFHINWGWGSAYDGYFTIGSLNPGVGGIGGNSTGTYNVDNVVLIGIRPNTNWSTTATTTITATVQGGGGTVQGGGSYSFGDTISLLATANAGYRFKEWSDGCKFNPREMFANGGSYSFTATFEPVSGDTLHYCPSDRCINSYGSATSGDHKYWGIHLPSSLLNSASRLTAVQLYVGYAGTYDMTVYTGATHSTTAATSTLTFTTADEGQWKTIPLSNSIAATDDIWIIFHSNTVDYPATFTYYSGADGSFIYGQGLNDNSPYWQVTAMVKGIFASATSNNTDTLDYCGNGTFATGIGTNGGAVHWGIMLPASTTALRGYLKSVMLYVQPDYVGTYTLNIYSGGDTVPGTLVHTQTTTFTSTQTGWQEIPLNAVLPLPTQNLWVTFNTTGLNYPMSACAHTGSPNSDWLSTNGTAWAHSTDYNLNYSWMIKAVTSLTVPVPATTVRIASSRQYLAKGQSYTFTATASSGATVTWNLQGASPATATGTSATATWNTAGIFNVIATATSSHGVARDTMPVTVIDYAVGDTLSYVFNMEHMTRVGTGDSSAFGWGVKFPSSYLANRAQLTKVLVGIAETGQYTLQIYQGGDTVPQTQIGTNYTITVTANDTVAGGYKSYTLPSPLSISSTSSLWVVVQCTGKRYPAGATDVSPYSNSDWTYYDGSWAHLQNLGVLASWEIKVVTANAPNTYTITATSSNPAWGSVTGGGIYTAGSTATLTATANSGYHFVQWHDGNTSATRTVTVTGNATYTATFAQDAPVTYTLTVTSSNPAWGTVTGGGTYTAGSIATLTATANSGYHFVQWQDGNTSNTRTVVVNGNATYTATFAQDVSYTLTVTSNDTSWGTVTGGGTYTSGQSAILTATAATHYHFVQWQDGDTTNPRIVTVMGNASYEATFAPNTYTITVEVDAPGSGTVTGGGTYSYGSSVTLTATAAEGYHFVQWQDGYLTNPRTVTVTGNATYKAFFTANPPVTYTVTALSNNRRWGTVSGGGVYNAGSMATLTATANEGYHFVQWNDSVSDNPRTIEVTSDTLLIAAFAADIVEYTIDVFSANPQMGTVTGGGRYEAGSTATITATALEGYHFVSWNDGVTVNPRTVVVTADSTFIASFAEDGSNGIAEVTADGLSLAPNPATTTVTLKGVEAGSTVTLVDVNGRVSGVWKVEGNELTIDVSDKAKGVYFVRTVTGTASATHKLIVK